jgi:hypothetical protein
MSSNHHRNSTTLVAKQTEGRVARSLAQSFLWRLGLRPCAFFLFSAGLAASGAIPAFVCEGYIESKNVSGGRQVPVIDARVEYRVENNPATGTYSIVDLKSPPRAAYTHADDLIDMMVVRSATETNERTVVQVSRPLDGYPVDWDWDQRVLWFTYCATDYLRDREGKHVIIPGGDPRHDAHVAACRASMLWRSEEDISPTNVVFRIDWELLTQAPNAFKLQPPGRTLNEREDRFQALMQVLKEGQMMARFQVKKWISFEKINVPEEWVLERFDSSERVARIYEGKTTSIKPLSRNPSVTIPETAEVVDKRVRSISDGINYVTYSISNGQILELKSPDLGALTARRVSKNMYVRPPDLWRKRALFIALITVILLSPLAVMLVRQFRQNKQRVSGKAVSGNEMKQT